MIATLAIAALSLALDVPYLPQTDALCGGAATAMVLRYWGDAHADPQEFAPLVDRRAGGIADNVLVDAVERRGWRVQRFIGSRPALSEHLAAGHPVIVLLADRGSLYHYVVVTGESGEGVKIHDPSWGPSRTLTDREFDRRWRASNFWSLVVLPPEGGIKKTDSNATADRDVVPATKCDAILSKALADIRTAGLGQADAILAPVFDACPHDAGPWRELAGVRFGEHRWGDAATLARHALERDSRDAYAIEVLGSSLFMQDDSVGALRAWNQVGKPRVDLVRIEGVTHARYQTIAEALSIHPNELLTADAFERARRRLDDLPDHAAARLAVRPEADGFATVDIVVVERGGVPQGRAEWAATGIRTAVQREAEVALPGTSGAGEVWSAKWRWWENRPGVAVGFAAPRTGALHGVWSVDASWAAESYATGQVSLILRETRTHGGLTISDWISHGIRYSIGAGADAWGDARKTVSFDGGIEKRFLDDRVAVAANAERWIGLTGPSFQSASLHLRLQSHTIAEGWDYVAAAGAERVDDSAPLALWAGAGDGRARSALARAHPLLDSGVIDLSGRSLFGRSLLSGTVETQRWLSRPQLPRVAIAAFADIARVSRGLSAAPPTQVDAGIGARVKIPGVNGVLCIDAARGLVDGRHAVTFAWRY